MSKLKAMSTKELMEYEEVRDLAYISKRIKQLAHIVYAYNEQGVDMTKHLKELKKLSRELEQVQ